MNYLLINRNNKLVDILDNIRYIKLIPETGLVIACEPDEGTGVIGSDCDTHYPLIKSDLTSNPNAVRVLEVEDLPINIRPNVSYFDPSTGELKTNLNYAKQLKQTENKELFSEYLSSHPLTWVNGKQYGVTLEDQSEIALRINQYNLAPYVKLEWHAKQEEDSEWDIETLTNLSLAIQKYVYPIYHKMQQYKTDIYACETIDELEEINISYEE